MPTMATVFTHWKSTAKGILIFIITTCGVFTSAQVFNGKAGSAIGLVSALAYAYLGIISKDSGTVEAVVPGNAAPQAVPSHEVPDDPKNKVVT